jgi:hypothetical protein
VSGKNYVFSIFRVHAAQAPALSVRDIFYWLFFYPDPGILEPLLSVIFGEKQI